MLVAYDLLRGHLKFGADIGYCRTFVRSAFSPSNMEEGQKEYDLVCEWNKAAFSVLPMLDIHSPVKLKSDLFASFPKVKEQMLTNYRQEGENLVASFNEAVERLLQVRAAMEHSSLERTLSILWPLLLGISVALRITKVTGELRLEK